MKRTIDEIRQEIKKRGANATSTQDIVLWGIMFSIEDLEDGLKKV